MVDEYRAARIHPKRVWVQSFLLSDVLHWIEAEPRFGKQAVYLDDRYETLPGFNFRNPAT
jgi:glycerophosphoryl diester phosphodiesterase